MVLASLAAGAGAVQAQTTSAVAPPARADTAVRGTLLKSVQVAGQAACQAECQRTPGCTGYNLAAPHTDPKGGNCSLHGGPLTDIAAPGLVSCRMPCQSGPTFTNTRPASVLPNTILREAGALKAPSGAPPPPPPSKTATALGAVAVPAPPVKPPGSQRANTGPGTQTEDDVYVGVKRPVQGVNTPGTTTPQVRPGAGTSPNTSATTVEKTARSGGKTARSGGKTSRAGGDDDLEDLEVERRKVQGVNTPGTATPQVRPGAGTSPNTGRSITPGLLPLPPR